MKSGAEWESSKALSKGRVPREKQELASETRAWSASPCDSIDRSLTDKSRAEWAHVIEKQLHAKRVDVLQSFRFEGWSIIYVDSREADETFLFYSHSPLRNHYVTMWSGAARKNEYQSFRAWTRKNAPRIPSRERVVLHCTSLMTARCEWLLSSNGSP